MSEVEVERLMKGGGDRYSFESHYQWNDHEFALEAAFTALKLMEISVINPEKAEALSKGMAVFSVSSEAVHSPVGVDDYMQGGPRDYVAFVTNIQFLEAHNELNRMHRELQLAQDKPQVESSESVIIRVSTQDKLFEKAQGVLQCRDSFMRRDFILRHRQDFLSTHVQVQE